MSSINGDSALRLDSDYVPSHNYEVIPCRWAAGSKPNEARTGAERCQPDEAQFWGVYRQAVLHVDHRGPRVWEWVSDHDTQQLAEQEAQRLRDQDRQGNTPRHQENVRRVAQMAGVQTAKRYAEVAQELKAGGHSAEDQLAMRIIHVASLVGTYGLQVVDIASYLGQTQQHIQTIVDALKKTGKL